MSEKVWSSHKRLWLRMCSWMNPLSLSFCVANIQCAEYYVCPHTHISILIMWQISAIDLSAACIRALSSAQCRIAPAKHWTEIRIDTIWQVSIPFRFLCSHVSAHNRQLHFYRVEHLPEIPMRILKNWRGFTFSPRNFSLRLRRSQIFLWIWIILSHFASNLSHFVAIL